MPPQTKKKPNWRLDYGEDPAQWAMSREEADKKRFAWMKRVKQNKGKP
jgi:hypothetical protein